MHSQVSLFRRATYVDDCTGDSVLGMGQTVIEKHIWMRLYLSHARQGRSARWYKLVQAGAKQE